MRVSNALIHQLIDKEYVDSVQKEQEITVFVSCNDALYIGRTLDKSGRLIPEPVPNPHLRAHKPARNPVSGLLLEKKKTTIHAPILPLH